MKTERIYFRISQEDKQFLQEVAGKSFDGTLSALFEDFIRKLKEKEGDTDGST